MRPIKTEHKLIAAIMSCSLAVFALAACTTPDSGDKTSETVSSDTITISSDLSEAFSDKDLDVSYDESEVQTITLNGASATSDSSSVKIEGPVITIKGKGTYVITGTLDDGYIVVDAGNSDDIRIILKDASITSSDYAALYCLNADNVYITLDSNTRNVLKNGGAFDSKDDNNVDGAIFAKTDITINGSGSLEVISTDHGIVGKDDVTIAGGNIVINSTSDGIQANDSVVIQEAVIDITCGKDGIQADNDKDLTKGYVYISSGTVTISAGDDGITASSSLQIDGGTVDITESYEGLEGQNITINGGVISIVSSDDGINAVSATSSGEVMQADGASTLTINGGEIYVRTQGDGVDSNGTFEMTGGTLTVMGPTSGANGSLDVNGSAVITGGTVIMAGASGMATNFTSASQGTILINTGNQASGSEIKVTDSSGKVILQATADSSYQTVLVSSPDLVQGNSYTITAGSYSETITLTDNLYGSGAGFGGPGGGFDNPGPGGFGDPGTGGPGGRERPTN